MSRNYATVSHLAHYCILCQHCWTLSAQKIVQCHEGVLVNGATGLAAGVSAVFNMERYNRLLHWQHPRRISKMVRVVVH